MDFIELEIVSEFADGRLVPAMFILEILAVKPEKYFFMCRMKNTVNQ